jgi:hypothetical protein
MALSDYHFAAQQQHKEYPPQQGIVLRQSTLSTWQVHNEYVVAPVFVGSTLTVFL